MWKATEELGMTSHDWCLSQRQTVVRQNMKLWGAWQNESADIGLRKWNVFSVHSQAVCSQFFCQNQPWYSEAVLLQTHSIVTEGCGAGMTKCKKEHSAMVRTWVNKRPPIPLTTGSYANRKPDWVANLHDVYCDMALGFWRCVVL
jgi:hypothetical protein